jgi:hypothetical protein
MRCLFCKADSSSSRSIEHIIPESLGNLRLTLPAGVVCDDCNNYFAREVEKPFLESLSISMLRFHQEIPSKKGRVPSAMGFVGGASAIVRRQPGSHLHASIELPTEGIERLLAAGKGTLILPGPPTPADLPSGSVLSRFVAKIALEAMALRLVEHPDGLEYLVDEDQFDSIRNHARRGDASDWPVHVRQIYDQNTKWIDESNSNVQIVHESDILRTDRNEWFFVIALFGVELVINYGGPEIEGYRRWLTEHDNASPLYAGKNAAAKRLRRSP